MWSSGLLAGDVVHNAGCVGRRPGVAAEPLVRAMRV
jgi:hypothetical protein